MTREQMLEYIKNTQKGQEDVTKVGGPAKKSVTIGHPKKRGLSLSNLFHQDYQRDLLYLFQIHRPVYSVDNKVFTVLIIKLKLTHNLTQRN